MLSKSEATAVLDDVLNLLSQGTADDTIRQAMEQLRRLRAEMNWYAPASLNADLRAQLRYLFYYRFTLGDKMEDQLREREPARCRQIYDLLKE